MKHWGELAIESQNYITGQGLVLVVDLKRNNLVEDSWIRDVLIKRGDTFDNLGSKYEVMNLELRSNCLDGKVSNVVGLRVKNIS